MKHDFENWLENQEEITDNKREIFCDAVKCYKAGIYRPAFMLSYIGFLFIVKDRFLKSEMPSTGYVIQEWDDNKKKLRNERTWEEQLIKLLAQTESTSSNKLKPAPFSISEDLRTQIKYWKDRRNDCAHYRNNDITESHVIAFWAFLKSKLPLIHVVGGVNSLINKINLHYDIAYTPRDSDPTPIVQNVGEIISSENYKEILEAILKRSSNVSNNHIFLPYFVNTKIQSYLLKKISEDDNFFKHFVRNYPEKISLFLTDPTKIRHFWFCGILDFSNQTLNLYSQMLLANMIPSSDLHEANLRISEFLYQYLNLSFFELRTIEKNALLSNHFYDDFTSKYWSSAFLKSNLQDISRNKTDLYMGMIDKFGFNKMIVESICDEINYYPYVLSARIYEKLKNDKVFFDNFQTTALDNNITIPPNLLKFGENQYSHE